MHYSKTQANALLGTMGFRGSFATRLGNFQAGYNLGPALVVDRLYGPKSDVALYTARSGKASAHFAFREFACKCGGTLTGCEGVKVARALLAKLEIYRAKNGSTRIVSGYRCRGHNARVGGATNSQHLYGTAADLDRRWSWQTVKSWRLFSGIGYKGSNGLVQHVDVRSNASAVNPTVWIYS